MKISRRAIGQTALALAIAGGSSVIPNRSAAKVKMQSLTDSAAPITFEERLLRIEKAQSLMRQLGIGALIIEPGSSLNYFTGIRWWRSERFTGAVLIADGPFCIVTPYFEEPSIREQMAFGDDVRTWHEHESPFVVIAEYLREKKIQNKPIAVEETTRHFVVDGLERANGNLNVVSGQEITRNCRMFKSAAEIALMQKANEITLAAYHHTYTQISVGMSAGDVAAIMDEATRALGGTPEFSMALFGEASAFPHGTSDVSSLKEGDVILMDCGCKVFDYSSDISRTWVMGEPTKRQREVWRAVKNGQELALETAENGVEAGRVDDVVRGYYESLGFGPDYKMPGLSHRLGHGIGMDGHEPVNFVRGEKTSLSPGMCFSNEPGIYIPGSFGVRLEDCFYITEKGPVLFTPLSKSIDKPFG